MSRALYENQGESAAGATSDQSEIACPQCGAPVMSADGLAVNGVLLDDVECECGFRGLIHWSSPSKTVAPAERLS
jgi:hypothetical protein